jgi:uncharacterized membrane protein
MMTPHVVGGYSTRAAVTANQGRKPEFRAMDNETISQIIRRSLNPDFAMDWDFFLACVPLVLAYILFGRPGKRGPLWWLGLTLFILFLPNAAYPLTDILHFVLKVRQRPYLPTWAVGVIVVPEYLLFISASFLAYVFSLQLLGDYLRSIRLPRMVRPVEVLLHAACAVGIYLGRALRLNSWDALTKPATVAEKSVGAFDHAKSLLFIAGTAFVIAIAYYLVGLVTMAIRHRRPAEPGRDELLRLLDRNGYEVGRDSAGRLFLRRRGLDWPPVASALDEARAVHGHQLP